MIFEELKVEERFGVSWCVIERISNRFESVELFCI